MKIDATLQARMGSSRLPGKTLKPILGKPLLAYQIERIQQSRLIERIIVATTEEAQDDAVAALAQKMGVHCYRGAVDDVLGRIVNAITTFDVEINVEFQGDNPLPDPLLVDSIIGFFLKYRDQYDYVTNALKTTYPPGAEVSVYPAQVLIEAEKQAHYHDLREHVGIHIYQKPELFRIFNLEAPPWLHFPDLHLEVDTAADFDLVSQIVEHFYPRNPFFGLRQIIDYAVENDLGRINASVERRWKQYRSD